MTVKLDQPVVLFLVGGMVNDLRAVRKGLFVARALRGMTAWLKQHPETGFITGEVHLVRPAGMTLISYWRAFEDVEWFARSKDCPHLEAWSRFAREIGTDGSVGIWHETYEITPSTRYEAIYTSMGASFGLMAAAQAMAADDHSHSARERFDSGAAAQAQPLYPFKDE
jgi:hypothetical protein